MRKITIISLIKYLLFTVLLIMAIIPSIFRRIDLNNRKIFLDEVKKILNLSKENLISSVVCHGVDRDYNKIDGIDSNYYYRIEYDNLDSLRYLEVTNDKYSLSLYGESAVDISDEINIYPNNNLYCSDVYSFKVKADHAKVIIENKQINKNTVAYAFVQPFYGYKVKRYKCTGNYSSTYYSSNILSVYNVNSPVTCEFVFSKKR